MIVLRVDKYADSSDIRVVELRHACWWQRLLGIRDWHSIYRGHCTVWHEWCTRKKMWKRCDITTESVLCEVWTNFKHEVPGFVPEGDNI